MNPSPARLLSNVAYSVLYNLANILFPLATLVWVSRRLGASGLGEVSWAISVASYFALFAAFGMGQYGTRSIAQCQGDATARDRAMDELFSIQAVAALASSAAFAAVAAAIPELRRQHTLLLPMVAMVLATPFSLDWFFQGLEKFKYIALRSIAVKAATLACMIYAVRGPGDTAAYAWIYVAGICLNYVFNFNYALRLRGRWPTFRFDIASVSRPMRFTLISFAISLYLGLDKILLGAIAGYASVGYYTPAEKIVRSALTFAVAIPAAILPRMSSLYASADSGAPIRAMFEASVHAVLLVAAPLSIGIAIFARQLIMVFGGDGYMPSVPVLRTMSMIMIPVALANVLGVQVLVASGNEKKYLLSVLGGTTAFACSAALLIPRHGAVGAAASMVIAETTGMVLQMAFALPIVGEKVDYRQLLPILPSVVAVAASAATISFAVGDQRAAMLAAAVLCPAIYAASLFAFRDALFLRAVRIFVGGRTRAGRGGGGMT